MATSPTAAAVSPPDYAAFQASALALGGVAEGESVRFDRGGRRFFAVWTSARKSTPPRLVITTPAGPLGHPQESTGASATSASGPFRSASRPRIQSPAPLMLRFETSVDRAGKSLRINRETQTGDAAFDERVYLESDASDELVLAALADPSLRENVVQCLTLGCTQVTLDLAGNLGVELPLPREELIAPASITALLDALGAAAEAIPLLVGQPGERGLARLFPVVAVVGTLASWPLFYLSDALWEPIGSDLYISAVLAGIALWIVSLPILYFVLRGRSVSLRQLVICVLALAIGFPLGGTDLVLTLNGVLDASPPEGHETRVTKLRKNSGKNSFYRVTVASWHAGEETIEINVGRRLYDTLQVGQPLTVTTVRGFLGWERMTSMVPAANRD